MTVFVRQSQVPADMLEYIQTKTTRELEDTDVRNAAVWRFAAVTAR